MAQDNKVTLEVKSTKGAFEGAFNVSSRGAQIVDEAIRRQGLDRHPPLPYQLKRARDGALLPVDAKIATYELRDHDVVIVQTPESTDG